jgi:hypothetical protein
MGIRGEGELRDERRADLMMACSGQARFAIPPSPWGTIWGVMNQRYKCTDICEGAWMKPCVAPHHQARVPPANSAHVLRMAATL